MNLIKTSVNSVVFSILLVAGMAQSAYAGLIGVKSIEITNGAGGSYVQIREIEAFNTSLTNVAASSNGGVATATSNWQGYVPANAIDGNLSSNYYSGSPTGILTITFAAVQELDLFKIFSRMNCCTERNIFNLSFLNGGGDVLASLTDLDLSSTHYAEVTFATVSEQPIATVPEPSILAMFGVGLLGLGLARRRRKGQVSL